MRLVTLEEIKELLQTNSFDLQPTQTNLCLPILQRIYHKMNIGVEFNSINVSDELLIEGHHRYICSLLLKKAININDWNKPSYIVIGEWSAIEIDENDWESAEIIRRHNIKDAVKSGLDIKSLEL